MGALMSTFNTPLIVLMAVESVFPKTGLKP